ncbi:MAG: histidine phosphatase family protein, partial [Myxococcota bacterium]
SALGRTVETARLASPGIICTQLEGLNERRVGIYEGQVLAADQSLLARYLRRRADPHDDLEGGETLEQHHQRVAEAVHFILRRHFEGNLLIIGHGLTNAQIMRTLLDLSVEQTLSFRQANDELYLVHWLSGGVPIAWKAWNPSLPL